MAVRFFLNRDINYYKWDKCIKESLNSSIYAYSWYLNTVCEKWDALIEGDYESVMPLPEVRKYNYSILRNPTMCYQLGIFSPKRVHEDLCENFLQKIPEHYRKINLAFNKYNSLPSYYSSRSLYHFELDLFGEYNRFAKRYSQQLSNCIAEATNNKITLSNVISSRELILFSERIEKKDTERSKLLHRLISICQRYKLCKLVGAYDKYNTLVAAVLIIITASKIYFIYGNSDENGKKEFAMYSILDHIIKKNCNKNLTLSFDYSSPYLAAVFSSFHAVQCSFPVFIRNKLPFYLKPFIR